MGYVIGTGTFPSTWLAMRTLVTATVPPPPFPNPFPVFGDHNQEWPVSAAWLKTIEGNGLIRISTPAVSGPAFIFAPSQTDPPGPDFFSANNFAEPYPEQLTGRGVTTAGSAFTILAEAFDGIQEAGSGGQPPISVEWFEAIT
jgi:hypothetical protein